MTETIDELTLALMQQQDSLTHANERGNQGAINLYRMQRDNARDAIIERDRRQRERIADILAACEAALPWYEKLIRYAPNHWFDEDQWDAIDEARGALEAAIAKAKGGTPS